MLTERTQAWFESGKIIELEEHPAHRIFLREREGDGPLVLFLHGYPSSSYDWRFVLDRLPGKRSVCFDFLGFGLSDKPSNHVYSLHEQADITEAILRRCQRDGERVILVAHDMGTSVATELLARALEGRPGRAPRTTFDRVLLFNGSMVVERASLTLSQKMLRSRLGPLFARWSNETLFRAQFARIFSQAHPLRPEEAADQWSLLAHAGGNRILDRLTSYIHERTVHASRWHGALRHWPGQLELAWGMRDPVATASVLDAVLTLRPHAPLTRWDELGHYPQIEGPGAVVAVIERLVREVTG
ncbi:alpha/beta fold hydrolase [Pendulispora albinea]|uniref:Alpha/beta hydrolase n=1 Tax=Pendulispora albinea TaxID=2741071 RepID=A0ABZ2LQA6_9BACT